MSKIGISRRRFMKIGLTGALGAAASMKAAQKGLGHQNAVGVSRTSLNPLRSLPTTCRQCPAGCGVIAYLDGERLVQILGNPNHPNNMGTICAKGIAGINLVNDPERLLYPMRRRGSRGSGEWTRITWDEVYYTLGQRIQALLAERNIGGLVVDKGQSDPLLDRFLKTIGTARVIDRPAIKDLNRAAVLQSAVGVPTLIEDAGRCRTIFNFGANPFASHDLYIGMARRVVLAQVENGARLITFDVRMSETAVNSQAWYPIKAGTDGIVALAMAREIIEKGHADKEFIDRMTDTPLAQIRKHLFPFTPEMAESESGIKAEDIRRLASTFATQKPSLAMFGRGISDHQNGTQNIRCVTLLNWLVGNLEKKGGLFFPRSFALFPADELTPAASAEDASITGIMDLKEANIKVDTFFAYLSNPAYSEPDCASSIQMLEDEKAIPFLVVMDTHLTETATLADLVLPAATYLEGWGVTCAPSLDRIPILNLRQPVVSLESEAKVLRSLAFKEGKLLEPTYHPRGEAKEAGNFVLELAKRLEGDIASNLPFQSTEDYVRRVISSIPETKKQGGLTMLKKTGVWSGKTGKQEALFDTSERRQLPISQKIKISFYSLKKKEHSSLPAYQPLHIHKQMKEGMFVLTTFNSSLIVDGTVNSKWAREIFHENRVWINKDAAEKLGIKSGDKVRVISETGRLITRALTTGRIHPQSVALAAGFGHTATGNVAKAKRFKSSDQDAELIWWQKEGNGVNPNRIIQKHKDPISGGLGLKDTVVRIERIQ